MAADSQYAELAREVSAIGALRRALARTLPVECPSGPAAVLALLHRNGQMRLSALAELLAVDMSVTSRHVAHAAERGWVERCPDPGDRRSRILRLTPAGKTMIDELAQRTTEMFARTLHNWSDDDVGQLNALLARLRESFGDCRSLAAIRSPRDTGDTPAVRPPPDRPPTAQPPDPAVQRPAVRPPADPRPAEPELAAQLPRPAVHSPAGQPQRPVDLPSGQVLDQAEIPADTPLRA